MACCKKEPKIERVFGTKISKMQEADLGEGGVPLILKDCAKFLRENGLGTEGLFRKGGNAIKMKQLKVLYNEGKEVDLATLGGIHQAASAIKTFLRDMRDPLLTNALYSRIMRFQLKDQATNEREVRNMLMGLPPRNLTTLRALVMFLAEVCEQADKNGMTVSNVAIVFSPNLCWAKGAGPSTSKIPDLTETAKLKEFTEFMMENCGSIFANIVLDGYVETIL
mmetsp:Transcript_110487/g.155060  ORF Transcript_110487/g.155060 Transcript_110487/m.155060 type:complete len:223 (+) Transcript_110487:313-981(+)